ncbi:MAG: DUF2145 domain-containing protein [Betaproteobacteria bacterium]|nr:DUF2145 domain-containing protein [Betaproteobacteria bacterium]
MNSPRFSFAALALAIALPAMTAIPAHAGRTCEARPPQASSVARGMDLADRTARALDASGAEVVVLARAGQDLSKYGLRWSHLGLAYKETSDTGVRWRVVHKLNQCGSPQADLYRQGLGEFFLDDPWEYRAGFAVLAPEVQMKLHALLHDNVNVQRLHQADYNMLAYPWAQRYQQSNQWAIETLAMAMEPGASTRERAQAWLQFKGYQPSTLRLNAMTRLGARMTAANIAFDDHPNDKRYGDRIETVTADSVFQWLERAALAGRVQVVR